MTYLFDVNVLVALAHQDHSEHKKVSAWFQSVFLAAKEFQTCSITELGFVRISVQTGLSQNVDSAQDTLAGLKTSSRVPFVLVPDALGVAEMPKYVKGPAQLTDGHLLKLSEVTGAKLVTLDKGIPGSLRIT